MEMLNNIPLIAKYIVISLFFFILVREIICWYFKINERIELLKGLLVEAKKSNNHP